MKKLLVVVSTLMFTMSISACNTIKGMGKDVERGGEKMQQKSDDVRK